MSPSLGLVGAGLAGLAAGVLMTLFEFAFWKKWGLEGVAEWQVNSVMVSVLIRKFTQRRPGALMAVAMHLFHATILGILFLVLLILSQAAVLLLPTVVCGVVYSIVLWIVSPYLTRGLFESAGCFRMTTKGLTSSLLAHIVYGVFLGLLVPVLV
ncbi:MAG TPA: hypothetical protein VGS11_07355 [Candidatus Bathyarchaeia archaeon]|nr:hypothetical protein [Candidatus Bathyarchaeia archaeon]